MTPGVYNLPVVDVYPQMESAVWLAMTIYDDPYRDATSLAIGSHVFS